MKLSPTSGLLNSSYPTSPYQNLDSTTCVAPTDIPFLCRPGFVRSVSSTLASSRVSTDSGLASQDSPASDQAGLTFRPNPGSLTTHNEASSFNGSQPLPCSQRTLDIPNSAIKSHRCLLRPIRPIRPRQSSLSASSKAKSPFGRQVYTSLTQDQLAQENSTGPSSLLSSSTQSALNNSFSESFSILNQLSPGCQPINSKQSLFYPSSVLHPPLDSSPTWITAALKGDSAPHPLKLSSASARDHNRSRIYLIDLAREAGLPVADSLENLIALAQAYLVNT
ncbi:unnamed protein product [Protopolystoma xenopodis]|uniref:Uncharacterized protein n=1 Tax=Protopolystoma xenopodis TaxID=117903 RepID=A0A448XE47_9PLAT|nr:unnamed protein product [Protopolystoma xenopodis]